NLLLRKMTADMLEAYASLRRQAVQRPLILCKQGGKAGISFGSRSVQAVHGDLIGYAVQETIREAVIVIKIDAEGFVKDIRAADLHIMGASDICQRTPP